MKTKLIIVGVFLVAVVAIFFLTHHSRDAAHPDPSGSASAVALAAASASGAGAGGSTPRGDAIELTMLYSSEKKEWIEDAATTFRKDHPEVKLVLIPKGSIEGAQAILDGKEKPIIFSPADSVILNLFQSDFRTKYHEEPFPTSGDGSPTSLVITPLVFVAWEDRAQTLIKAGGGSISWKSLDKAIASNKGWPAVGGKSEWGFVKLGHTDPTKSNSGLQTILLMVYELLGKRSGLEVGDLLKPEVQNFVKEIEKGVPKFESSTGTFMTDMIRFGPSKYDVAAVYESLAIAQIENAQGRWGNLRVYYPQTTLWSDHPAVLLTRDITNPKQREVAHKWLDHLRSRAVQTRALSFGFRPGDLAVPIKTPDGQNPFTRLAANGLSVDIPPVAAVPDGAVIRNLLTMWARVVDTTGR